MAAAAKHALEILTRSDRGRSMGQQARINAKKRFCSNDIVPLYESYYQKVLSATTAAHA